jgi:2-polyprenyl-3-methyl-5-hydroxy-6-metoxy-1,4-benzoquinol methylase
MSPTLAKLAKGLGPVTCGLCGSDRKQLRFRQDPYSVVTCKTCDLTYVTPRLSPQDLIEKVYDEGYWVSDAARERGYSDYCGDEELYLRTFQRRTKLLDRFFGLPGRVLDVGCAAGYFLRVMRDAGWDAWGVEPSASIHSAAAESLGAERIHCGDLSTLELPERSFDLITMWDVLEHTPDPVASLWRASGFLKPSGRIVIETQNVKSFMARLLGRRWQHYKHAEHLYHFHPGTLKKVLERAELTVLEMTPRHAGKQVSPAFVVERAARLHPWLPKLLKPLLLLPERGMYVNLRDELIVVAEPR